MKALRELFPADAVDLNLAAGSKAELLSQMIGLLRLDDVTSETLYRVLLRREELGSTGVGRGIAIPHCRSSVVARLQMAYGRVPAGVDFGAVDGKLVHHLFLIAAPPVEVANDYLPALGRLATFARAEDVPARLLALKTAGDFIRLLADRDG